MVSFFRKALVYSSFLAQGRAYLVPAVGAAVPRGPTPSVPHSRRFAVGPQASVALEKGSEVIAREPATHPAFELVKGAHIFCRWRALATHSLTLGQPSTAGAP